MVNLAAVVLSLALLVGIVATPVSAQESTPAATAAQGAPVDVNVTLEDFSVTVERTTFIAGQPYRFLVTNAGTTPHEFVLEPAGEVDEPLEVEEREAEIEDIAPGLTKELVWTFAEPGDYQMACHVPGHYEAGMKMAFTVVPPETEIVRVELQDFSLTPDATDLKADTPYLFEVTNAGQATHEFVIEQAGEVDEPLEMERAGDEVEAEIEDIAPGQSKTLLWTFAEAGDYQMACHVPGHYEAGMKTTFAVTA
jgi:uncharacterized cupredoxin-like copper-binding protein